MTITDIVITKQGRFEVYIEGEAVCALHPEVYALFPVRVGDAIEPEELERLQRETELKIAKDRAFGLLTVKDYTRRQLCDKLEKFVCREAAQEAVERIVELGLVDDLDYARRCASDLVRLKHFSVRRVQMELARRGVERDDIEQVLADYEEHDPRESIAQVLLRKYPRLWEDERIKKRAVNAMLRLGYAYDDIRGVVEHIDEYMDSEDPAENAEV